MNIKSKKSRKIIVCATAVLAVLLAVCCILIFTHRGGDTAIVCLASPTAVELQGDGAELFRAELLGTGSSFGETAGAVMHLELCSADDSLYTLGDFRWSDGVRSEDGRWGYVEKKEADGWQEVCDVRDTVDTATSVPDSPMRYLVSPENTEDAAANVFTLRLQIFEPGEYRIHLFARNFFPAADPTYTYTDYYRTLNGYTADVQYSVSFDFTVSGADIGSDDISLLYSYMEGHTPSPSGFSPEIDLSLGFYADSNLKYVQTSSIKLTPVKHEASHTAAVIDTGSFHDIERIYDVWCLYHERMDMPYNGKLIPVQLKLLNCEHGDEYTLSMTVAENADGSGASGTVQIRLRFE